MRRLRLGLNSFASPALQRRYGDVPQGQWLARYAEQMEAYEVTPSAGPGWTREASHRLLDMAPPGLRLLPCHTGRIDPSWRAACRPLLRSPRCGPVHVPWPGPWTPGRHDALDAVLDDLADDLPPGGHSAVEFSDPSWLRSDAMALLEMHEAILVWSTRTGHVPFRRTTDALYLRLTGHRARRGDDEVGALLARLRARPVEDEETFVIATRADQPFALPALQRFAAGMGRPVPWLDPPGHAVPQAVLA